MDIEIDSLMAEDTSGVGVKRKSLSPLPSSTMKRAKLDLPQFELTPLNVKLNDIITRFWPQEVSEDPLETTELLSKTLIHLINALAETSAKFDFISPLTSKEAKSFVDDFDLDERREWEDAVRTCMQRGDWTDLITHPRILKYEEYASSESRAERAERLHVMFRLNYQGDFHKLFVQGLDDYEKIYDPKKHFGRIIPVIQSSATGKSRMVKEVGNEVPTLSICFRPSPFPENGWPPRDEPARVFLLGDRPRDKQYKGEELAAAFLGAVMLVVAEKIEARADRLQEGDWMYDWRLDSAVNIVGSPRYACFTEVAARGEKLLLDNSTAIEDMRVSFDIQNITVKSAVVWHKSLFNMLCRPSFEKLSQILKKRNVKRFLLAFDECSELDRNKPSRVFGMNPFRPLWSMSLIALKRIIKAYDDFVGEVPVWFLLLDTNLSVIKVGEGEEGLSEKGYRSLPVWPYIGFNQMAKKNVFASADEKKLPTHVHSIGHLKRYGRPYWSTLTDDEVLGVADKKLFSDSGFSPYQENYVFTAFAVRAGLEISVGEASERLAMETVRGHMRILDAVDPMLMTSSPPEPIFAIAAAEAMNSSEEIYKTALRTLLKNLILESVVLDRGLQGELSTRLLLLRARDKATPGGNGFVKIDPISILPMVQPVELSKFLQTLLGDTLGIADEQRNVRDKFLKEASSVWINFTHIWQLSMSIGEVTESMLLNAWSTGTALQCVHNQPVIDGFIVGYRGSLDEPFQSSRLTTIPWRSKARSTAALLTAPFIVPQNGGSRYKPWHVVILMDLAASSAFGSARGPHCDLTSEGAARPKGEQETWSSYAETNESEGQRYCLNICGYRAVNYPVLHRLEKEFDTLFTRALGYTEPEFMPFAGMMAKAMLLD